MEQSCNAVVHGLSSSQAIYNHKLYFSLKDEKRNVTVFEADINGSNRRVVTRLKEIQAVTDTLYTDNYLIFTYQNNYDYSADEFTNVLMDKAIVGLVMVDLKTGKTMNISEKSAYSATINQVYKYKEKAYYLYVYNDVKIDYMSLDFSIPETMST